MEEVVDSHYHEIQRVSKEITDHRLDYTEAISMVIGIMPFYKTETHAKWAPRKFFREMCPGTFRKIKNANAAVQTYDFLKKEKHAAEHEDRLS